MLQNPRQRAFRRSRAIRAYVGINGSGKTLGAVWDLLPDLDAGKPVLSTARLLDFRNPRECEDSSCQWPGHPEHGAAHPAWVPMTDWRQLIGGEGHPVFRDGAVLLDEVAGVASSRESGTLPFQVARDLQQLRKRKVSLSFTAPSFARTEKIIRECTRLIVHARGSLPVRVDTGVTDVSWRRNRLTRWRAYDGEAFDSFTNASVSQEKQSTRPQPISAQWFWIPGSDAAAAYDSADDVLSLGWANESGMCLSCGGKRTISRCNCGPHVPAGDAEGAERRSSAGAHEAVSLRLIDRSTS
jgi:hypothetical protein